MPEFVVAVGPFLKLKVEATDEAISWKPGVRARLSVPLADVARFGHRRLADGTNALVELVFISKTPGVKLPKLPINPADPGAQALLSWLGERLPDADVSRLLWLEAAPLLGMKAYGIGSYLRYPLFGAGLAFFLLAGPASILAANLFSPDRRYQGVAVACVMVIGVTLMVVGWRRVRADRQAEEDAAKRRG